MKLICKTIYGSRLYGTATEKSDTDIRGVFLPSYRDIFLGRIPKTNKDCPDPKVDYELYSLHHFVKLACQGQTLAFDMLWTPTSQTELGEVGHIWSDLCHLRHKFLSKNMKAFIGYARTQATKYSLKGQRLLKLKDFLASMDAAWTDRDDESTLLKEFFDILPKDAERVNAHNIRELQIAGKWFGETTAAHSVYTTLNKTLGRYGTRAEIAANLQAIDWKALSHAVRVSYELRELILNRKIAFPLTEAAYIKDIKAGNISLSEIESKLDDLLIEVEELLGKSDLPKVVDQNFWDNWLYETLS